MPRYEFSEGSSNKFWEITLDGKSFTARWGRIGTDGQTKTQEFGSTAEAKKAYDKLIAEKVKKGYEPAGDGDDDGESDDGEAAPGPAAAELPRNPKLEAAVIANQDDASAWRVYADWLLESGLKWGEVIAAATSGKPDKAKQSAAQKQLFGEWECELTWANGVFGHLDFQPTEQGGTYDAEKEEYNRDTGMAEALEMALKHPAGRLARTLTLGLPPTEDTEWHMEGLAKAIGNAGPLPFLEELDMGQDSDVMDQPSWRRVGDIKCIWKAAPNLKVLRLQGAAGSDDGEPVDFGEIVAPNLELLQYKSGGLDEAVPLSLGKAKLPRLAHLELWFGRDEYGCTSTVESLDGILNGTNLPALKWLGLMNSEWEDELIEAIAKSKVLPRLEVLNLSMGVLASGAAQRLNAYAPKFKHLKELILDDNYFSDEQQAQMLKELPNARFGKQKEPDGDGDDEYRYTSVGE